MRQRKLDDSVDAHDPSPRRYLGGKVPDMVETSSRKRKEEVEREKEKLLLLGKIPGAGKEAKPAKVQHGRVEDGVPRGNLKRKKRETVEGEKRGNLNSKLT